MSFVAVGASAALIVAGAAINYYNTEQTEQKAENTEANEIEQQTALDKKANQDTQQLLNKDASNDNDTSQRSALMNQFQTALKANSPTATGGLNQVGNVSSAYTKAANDAASGISEYANSQASNLSNIMAPSLQRQNENAALAAYGSQIGAIGQQSQGDAALANIKLQGIQANPWLSAVGDGLESYGASGLGVGMLTGGGGVSGGYPTTLNANGQQVLAINPNNAGSQITYN
jgi:hypothetical protein